MTMVNSGLKGLSKSLPLFVFTRGGGGHITVLIRRVPPPYITPKLQSENQQDVRRVLSQSITAAFLGI